MAVAVFPRRAADRPSSPLRILTAASICDGDDSAVSTINLEFARHGFEVVYLGSPCPACTIARAAIQEDAHAVGISSFNGGHIVFFKEVVDRLRALGVRDIPVFGSSGGTITKADERVMHRQGIDRILHAGTPLADIVALIRRDYGRTLKPNARLRGDRALARTISLSESEPHRPSSFTPNRRRASAARSFVVGVTGPGGAGKSTLIDELTWCFLQKNPRSRIAIIANDPSLPDAGGAILGDRGWMIYAQDDRVFFRSLATRGSLTGLSAAAPAAIEILRASGEFDLILVESVGIGQESDPFRLFGKQRRLVDAMLFVLAPYYGGHSQLQKIGLLNGAQFVALNKCDHPMAQTARAEIASRLETNDKGQRLFGTVASTHHDPGVDKLYAAIAELGGLDCDARGGEKPCQMEVAG
ncbi:MAG: cobalamin-dependent protein [Opitutaceae bacterium]